MKKRPIRILIIAEIGLQRRRGYSGRYQDGDGARRLCHDGRYRRHRAGYPRRSRHPSDPAAIVREQIAWTLADIGADAIKIGMLGSVEIVETVADVLTAQAKNIPVVLDPVLSSTSQTVLLDEAGQRAMAEWLFPLATLITPNIPEAEILAGISIRGRADVMRAVEILRGAGAKAVLVKGGHGQQPDVSDTLVLSGSSDPHYFESPRIETRHTHGTGCTLSTAIAVGLGQGLSLRDAAERAHRFVHDAILAAPGFGPGHGPLNHMHAIPAYGAESEFED